MFETDIFSRTFYLSLGVIFVFLTFWWFFSIIGLVGPFLKAAIQLTGGSFKNKTRIPPFYYEQEIGGVYKGREVFIGIVYSGFRNEFLPLPFIQMCLKETVGYNTSRLPDYAVIQNNFLVYKVNMQILWGVFDRNFPQIFSQDNLRIALDRLLSIAEDLERGRTSKELFKQNPR
jgi:hypothetical protein